MYRATKYDHDDFYQKVAELQFFYKNRNQSLIPSNNKEFGLLQQKFLFFYNAFAKISGKDYTFSNLKAFVNGPVYNDIYYEHKQLSRGVYLNSVQLTKDYDFDTEIAETAMYMVSCFNADRISELTHEYDCWSTVYESYLKRGGSNDITDMNFTIKDCRITKEYYDFFDTLKNNYKLYKAQNNVIAILSEDYKVITDNFEHVLDKINEIHNPVMVELDETKEGIYYD